MKSYEDLIAWQVAMDLVENIYVLTSSFPKEELYGLTSQLRRSVNSIVANIAEGFGRYTFADKANKYTIARGECTEVEAFLHVAVRVGILNSKVAAPTFTLVQHVGRLLSGLIKACHQQRSRPGIPVF